MKKLSLVILVMFAALLLCSSFAFAGTPGVNVAKVTFADELVQLDYPQVRDMANEQAQHKINSVLSKEVNVLVADARKANALSIAQGGKAIFTSIRTSYDVRCNQAGILSITLVKEEMMEGAAHPLRGMSGLNFNSVTGESITAQSISKLDKLTKDPDQFAPKAVNAALKAAQKAGTIVLPPTFKGVTESVTNFYIDNATNVWAIFLPDEIAPYAAGIITVCLH
ncbi:MAG: DUF4163 domain-containing protein [Acidaminococcaceae bacterium]